ncbi:MAG: serine/threonine protein kinase, partial [Planctomycetes bacterium]|nr:serine/threonine protein kinase [Planctomycetota bacterium]
MSSAPRPDLGTVGPYELRAVLGRGGMGTVYRAWSPRHGREVALKLCAPGLASAEDCARLVREARLLAGVDHPFLIGFLDAGESRATPYLVMELVEGETLASTWARDPLWDPARAVSLVRQLAEGAGELHRLGIVHRDLKPANVLLDRRGSPQIADLGLAGGEAMSRLTQTGAVVGTPAYMAPEQVMAGRLTPATDVYALGVILFQLLTGRLPFTGHTPLQLLTQQLEARPPSVRALCPAAGPELAALVACCLEKDPGDRFPDGAGLARALDELSRADPRGGVPPAAPQRLTFVAALAAVA